MAERRARQRAVAAALVALVAWAAAAAPAAAPRARPVAAAAGETVRQPRLTWAGAGAGPASVAVVTRDRPDTYRIGLRGATLIASAPRDNRGINTRMLVWPKGVRPSTDSESCAAWNATGGPNVQMGAALRVTRAGNRVRAITLTQNVIGVQWAFNLHTWDTLRPGDPYRNVKQFDLSQTFLAGGVPPYPWTVCVRAVGNQVEFRIWAADEPDPGWGDPARGGSATLPEGWVHPGQSGWYVGHLAAGQSAGLTDLATWSYDEPPRAGPLAPRPVPRWW